MKAIFFFGLSFPKGTIRRKTSMRAGNSQGKQARVDAFLERPYEKKHYADTSKQTKKKN